jgi:hypothetical protein
MKDGWRYNHRMDKRWLIAVIFVGALAGAR